MRTFQDEVIELIDTNLKTYEVNPNRIITDYKGELEFTNAYNGRQLLELLQNADDAQTDQVSISLDTEQKKLVISNNGIPFDIRGIESLTLPFSSTKDKKEFIGNKGLGFRSILNWSKQVKVITKDIVLVFSPEIAKSHYQRFYSDSEKFRQIVARRGLDKNGIPFSILAVPEFEDNNNGKEWVTEIEIDYKTAFEKDIKKQLKAISEEILLFLNHTQQIEIRTNGERKAHYQKSILEENRIQVNNKTWHIYDSGEQEYEDDKYYHFKIAWQDGLQDEDTYFYTYFPTQVKTHLPCIIHATFELDAARNHLNESKSNRYILKKIAKALGEIAEKQLKKEISDWEAFKFLTPTGTSDHKLLDDFYKKIESIRQKSKVYPRIDNTYVSQPNAYYYFPEFNEWVIRNGFESTVLTVKNPPSEIYNLLFKIGLYIYRGERLLEIFTAISTALSDTKERAELIKHLLNNNFTSQLKEAEIKLPLLLEKKGPSSRVANVDTQVFFLRSEEISEYFIPSFVPISFIAHQLYEQLLSTLDDEINDNWNGVEDKSRPLKKILGKILNVGSNDITDVILRVISGTKKELELTPERKEEIIKEQVQSLYSFYSANPESRTKVRIEVPLLNRQLKVKNATELFFGESYPSGKINQEIFDGIYKPKQYLAEIEVFDIEYHADTDIEPFFVWLGVNKHIQIKRISESIDSHPYKLYYLFSHIRRPEKETHWEYSGKLIANIEAINELTIEKLIVLIYLEKTLFERLYYDNKDILTYTYGRSTSIVSLKPSIILYQLTQNRDFSQYYIESDIGEEFGLKTIDFKSELFKSLDIEPTKIKFILKQLGARESLNEVSAKEMYGIMRNYPKINVDGKNSQQFYKRVHDYFRDSEQDENVDSEMLEGMQYFARRGGKGKHVELKPIKEVYYTDNAMLPQNILDDLWFINLPKRLGEKEVKKYFGVNLLQEFSRDLSINDYHLSKINTAFQNRILDLQPYFLTYRISDIKQKAQQQAAAGIIKNIEIYLVSECTYQMGEGEPVSLTENAFVLDGNDFYLKSAAEDLASLKETPEFCDAIAEILCIAFKVKEHKNNFRSVFKDSLKETRHLIRVDENEHFLETAYVLLGLQKNELDFWENVFQEKGVEFPKNLTNQKDLEQHVKEKLNFELPETYDRINLNNLNDTETVNFYHSVSLDLHIPFEKLLTEELKKEGLSNYYFKRLEQELFGLKSRFENSLWKYLNNQKDRQKELIQLQNSFDEICSQEHVKAEVYIQRLNFNWAYTDFLIREVEDYFGFKLDGMTDKWEPTNLYLDLLQKYGVEENEITSPECRSLCYFKGNEQELETYLGTITKEQEANASTIVKKVGKLIYSTSQKLSPLHTNTSKGKRAGWSSNSKDAKRKSVAGKNAEELAYNTLLDDESIEQVRWVSGNSTTSDRSDAKHYDIRYKPINDDWKYLEVKSFNGKDFHLSRAELGFAIKHPKNYEIALVKDEEVHIQKDLFLPEVDFTDNDRFYAEPYDYLITLEIKDDTL